MVALILLMELKQNVEKRKCFGDCIYTHLGRGGASKIDPRPFTSLDKEKFE